MLLVPQFWLFALLDPGSLGTPCIQLPIFCHFSPLPQVAYTFLYWLPYYISTTEVGGRALTPTVSSKPDKQWARRTGWLLPLLRCVCTQTHRLLMPSDNTNMLHTPQEAGNLSILFDVCVTAYLLLTLFAISTFLLRRRRATCPSCLTWVSTSVSAIFFAISTLPLCNCRRQAICPFSWMFASLLTLCSLYLQSQLPSSASAGGGQPVHSL